MGGGGAAPPPRSAFERSKERGTEGCENSVSRRSASFFLSLILFCLCFFSVFASFLSLLLFCLCFLLFRSAGRAAAKPTDVFRIPSHLMPVTTAGLIRCERRSEHRARSEAADSGMPPPSAKTRLGRKKNALRERERLDMDPAGFRVLPATLKAGLARKPKSARRNMRDDRRSRPGCMSGALATRSRSGELAGARLAGGGVAAAAMRIAACTARSSASRATCNRGLAARSSGRRCTQSALPRVQRLPETFMSRTAIIIPGGDAAQVGMRPSSALG
jgi:hypothetical protein